jgi:hypothetical protein
MKIKRERQGGRRKGKVEDKKCRFPYFPLHTDALLPEPLGLKQLKGWSCVQVYVSVCV